MQMENPVPDQSNVRVTGRGAGGTYDHLGWRVRDLAATSPEIARLVSIHEGFHKSLDDTSSFGGYLATLAALSEGTHDPRWMALLEQGRAASRWTHEVFATTSAILVCLRPLGPIDGYPDYDRYVAYASRLVGDHSAWIAFLAIDAGARACMQSPVPGRALRDDFDDVEIVRQLDEPDARMILLESHYADEVSALADEVRNRYVRRDWWSLAASDTLSVDVFDGESGEVGQELRLELFGRAKAILEAAGAEMLEPEGHFPLLVSLLQRATALAPDGLPRIGALHQEDGLDFIDGGALDAETIELHSSRIAAIVAPLDLDGGRAGVEGGMAHRFITVQRRDRILSTYDLQGLPLPDGAVLALARRTAMGEGDELVVLSAVSAPAELGDLADVYVSVMGSAQAEGVDQAWFQAVPPERLSTVLDTPLLPALRRWLAAEGTLFACTSLRIETGLSKLSIIAGRLRSPAGLSPLIVFPTSDFGARLFDQAVRQDPRLQGRVVEDEDLEEAEDHHLQIVLNHLVQEERMVGPGSWRV